jgi:hypothetical protein
VEKLGELLRENPAGLLVLRDERVGLIATWEREGREGERAFFLETWNGNQNFDTGLHWAREHQHPEPCASIFGGIQPDKLTVYLEQAAHCTKARAWRARNGVTFTHRRTGNSL